jgi:hypothetical protein
MAAHRQVYIATIALEANRHAPGKRPTIRPSAWAERPSIAGFDGMELWENHALLGPREELGMLRTASLPVAIVNTYVEFTDDQKPARQHAAQIIQRLGSAGVKYNFGPLLNRRESMCAIFGSSPGNCRHTRACSVSAMPAASPRIPPGRRSQPSELARWFEHLGTRINHAHVFLPRMGRRRQEVGGVEAFHFLESVKYLGSFSIEFVEPLNGPGETAANLFDKAVADMRWLREAVGLKG